MIKFVEMITEVFLYLRLFDVGSGIQEVM